MKNIKDDIVQRYRAEVEADLMLLIDDEAEFPDTFPTDEDELYDEAYQSDEVCGNGMDGHPNCPLITDENDAGTIVELLTDQEVRELIETEVEVIDWDNICGQGQNGIERIDCYLRIACLGDAIAACRDYYNEVSKKVAGELSNEY